MDGRIHLIMRRALAVTLCALLLAGIGQAAPRAVAQPNLAPVSTITITAREDATIASIPSGTNYGYSGTLEVASLRIAPMVPKYQRALVRFDLSALPLETMIDSAELQLYLAVAGTPAGAVNLTVHRVTEAWNEGNVTWGTKPAEEDAPSASASVDGAVGLKAWDVTALVRSWRTGPNFGLSVRWGASTTLGARVFGSREQSSGTYRPRLVVNYHVKMVNNLAYLPIVLNSYPPTPTPTSTFTPTRTPTRTPTPTVSLTSSTRFANRTSYPIIYLTIDGVQYFQQSPQGVAPGYYHEIRLAPGAHSYGVRNGWWDTSGSRFEMYQWTSTFTQKAGVVGVIDFYDPTIQELLANFGSSAYWKGDFWIGLVPHTAGFCYYRNGTWMLYVDGAYQSSGTYSLVSRSPSTQSIQFTIGSHAGTLFELQGYFAMRNGPSDWPLIAYYRESHACP